MLFYCDIDIAVCVCLFILFRALLIPKQWFPNVYLPPAFSFPSSDSALTNIDVVPAALRLFRVQPLPRTVETCFCSFLTFYND